VGQRDRIAPGSVTLAEETGTCRRCRWASTIGAELDIREGRADAAEARLVHCWIGLAEECDVTALCRCWPGRNLELGRLCQATIVVEQALARARPEEIAGAGGALRVRALLALRQGKATRRRRDWRRAVLARQMPHPYAERASSSVC